MRRVWRWFCDLSDRRDWVRTVEPEIDKNTNRMAWRTHSRPERVGFEEILAWQEINGICLEPWQVAALTLMDDRFYEDATAPKPDWAMKPGEGDGGQSLVKSFERLAKRKKKNA